MTAKRGTELNWEKIRTRSAAQRRNLGQLSKDISALISSGSVDSITGYSTIKDELAAWQKDVREVSYETDQTLVALEAQSAEELDTLDERLARALREAGLEVHGETGLLIVDGVVYVETDKRKLSIRVNGEKAAAFSAKAVCSEVILELERIRTSTTPAPDFLALLCEAYEAEVTASQKPFGSQVTTSQLISRVALLKQRPQFFANPVSRNFRDYPKELFRADTYTLLKSNLSDVGGKRFQFASGSDTNGAVFMLIPQFGRAAHVGRIWFEYSES